MLDNQRRWAVALAAVFCSAAAFAQLTGTVGAQPVPPATPQQPGKVVGSLTFGGEVQNGRTETRGYMGSASFAYMNKRLQVFRLDLSSMHSDLRDRNTGTRYTLQETGSGQPDLHAAGEAAHLVRDRGHGAARLDAASGQP